MTHAAASRANAPSLWTTDRALVLTGCIALLAALATFGDAQMVLSPVGALALPPLVLGLLLAWKPKAWLYLATGITAVALPALFLGLFTKGSTFQHPLASREFIAGLLLSLAVLLALPFGIRGFVRARRGTPAALRGTVGNPTVTFAIVAVSVVAGAAFASAMAQEEALGAWVGAGYDVKPEEQVFLKTKDFEFDADRILVKAGVLTELVITNEDAALHTFTYTIDGRTLDRDLLPGATTRILVRYDTPGEYVVWCEPHTDKAHTEGMLATLVVQ